MAKIGLNTSLSGFSGQLIIRWVKASNIAAEVGRFPAKPFPYDGVDTIANTDPVVFIVQWWRSNDGVSLDQLIKDWSIDASIINEASIISYQYKAGRGHNNTTPIITDGIWSDPSDGVNIINDTRLAGVPKSQMIVNEAGYGVHIDSEYELVPAGGITLSDGRTFDLDVSWVITVIKIVAQQFTPTSNSSIYSAVNVLTADRNFYNSPTDNLYNNLCIANYSASVGIVNFLAFSLIPEGTLVTFSTHRGSQKYLKLQFNPGDTVMFNGQAVNVIYLAKCEKITLTWFGGECHIIDYDGKALQRGSVFADYDNSRGSDSGAYILADESTGELLGSDYPGLYSFVENLPSGFVPLGTNIGQWGYDSGGGVFPNKRYYGIQTSVPKKIRVPHLIGMVLKFGTTPGQYAPDAVGPIDLQVRNGSGGSSTNSLLNVGFSGMDNAADWLTNGAPGSEKYIRVVSPNGETEVKSVKQIPYIVL